MNKQQQFLLIVQTMFLSNAINLSLEPEKALNSRDKFSALGAFMFMDDAIYASERIPGEMTATEAANEFALHSLGIDPIPHSAGPQWFHRD